MKYQKSANILKIEDLHNITFISLEFNDFEVFKEAASKWSLEFKQLDEGKFYGDISIIESPQIQIGTTNLNRKLDQRGSAPVGYRTFIIPKQGICDPYFWRGHKVSDNDLLIQPISRDFFSISNPGWGIYTISIIEGLVSDYLEKLDATKSNVFNNSGEIVKLSPQEMKRLRKQLEFVFNMAKQNPSNLEKKVFRKIFSEEIPSMIISNIVSSKKSVSIRPPRIRDIAFRKAINYLNSCTTEMPSVSELCLISGSSERTLEYAFKEKYGFGPKEFMRKQLLNKVRQELLHAKPFKRIKDIAHRYGFMHLGHFSADYKKLFGELPSETLKSRIA